MLTLNLNLLYTVVNILVLFLLLRKFLYKPVMNIIAQRQKQVDDALNAAETSKQEAGIQSSTFWFCFCCCASSCTSLS